MATFEEFFAEFKNERYRDDPIFTYDFMNELKHAYEAGIELQVKSQKEAEARRAVSKDWGPVRMSKTTLDIPRPGDVAFESLTVDEENAHNTILGSIEPESHHPISILVQAELDKGTPPDEIVICKRYNETYIRIDPKIPHG